jgi:crossover junction endodeoxyribonuclease RusA
VISKTVRVTLPFPPSVNHYVRHFCAVDSTHQVRAALTKAARQYKHDAGWLAKSAGVRAVEGYVSVAIGLYRPRQVGDTDNTLKLILDSLNGIAWLDDAQVVQITVRRYPDDAAHPRVVVSIEEISELEEEIG